MSYLENEFNKRFGNQKLSDDDFDEDGLWDDISEDLDNDPVSGSTGSLFGRKWFSILATLLVFGGLIGFAYWQMSDSDSAIKKENFANIESIDDGHLSTSHLINKEEIANTNQTLEQETIVEQSLKNNQNFTQNSKTASNGEIKNRTFQNPENNNSTQFTSFDNVENESSFLQNGDGVQKRSETISSTTIENQPASSSTESTTNFNPKIEPSNSNLREERAIDELHLLPVIFMNLQSNNSLFPDFIPAKVEKNKVDKSNSLAFQLELISGINVLNFNHKTTGTLALAETRNREEKIFPGGSLGLSAGVQMKNGLMINSGIEYHQLWSKFDHSEERLIDSLMEDQLLKVWISETTGDTLNQSRGNINVEVLETRDIIHFNQYHRLSIPLEFGIRKTTGRFLYGISIGGVINFIYSQSGKMLGDTWDIVEFENNNYWKFKKTDFGFRAKSVVGYQSKNNWSLTLEPQWMWSQNPIRDFSETKVNFHQFNMNLGLGYSF